MMFINIAGRTYKLSDSDKATPIVDNGSGIVTCEIEGTDTDWLKTFVGSVVPVPVAVITDDEHFLAMHKIVSVEDTDHGTFRLKLGEGK